MKIGVISDSHGQARRTRRAVSILLDGHADLLLHLGDIETEEVLDELAGGQFSQGVRLVLGNCDIPEQPLVAHAEHLGLIVDHPIGRIDVAGRSIAYTHGHRDELVIDALTAKVDYFLHGHTHVQRDVRSGPTRIINPGALHRAKTYTVVLLDPAADRVEFIDVDPRDR